ncbi:MAG: DUF1320 domain-containing protein [Zoogloeaceae bacterium]|jgi:phage gp36-like protein|nr:DUF1320 domain-containing protein [Zoogloeaceae bacterium]
MNYASPEDLINAFGEQEMIQLTDRDNIPPAVVDVLRVEQACEAAQGVVDGYVSQRYALPIVGCHDWRGGADRVAPPLLKRLTVDIARYYLYDDLAPEHEVYRRYKSAERDLELIATGTLLLSCPLGDAPGQLIAGQGDLETRYCFSPRQVTDADLRGFA